jgi:hypothetical protein
MSDRGFHRIEADLEDSWLEDWAGVGIAELEAYLAKHAAFLSFLEDVKHYIGRLRARAARTCSKEKSEAYVEVPFSPLSAKPSDFSRALFGWAPIAAAAGSPLRKRMIVGIETIPYF